MIINHNCFWGYDPLEKDCVGGVHYTGFRRQLGAVDLQKLVHALDDVLPSQLSCAAMPIDPKGWHLVKVFYTLSIEEAQAVSIAIDLVIKYVEQV